MSNFETERNVTEIPDGQSV